MSGTPSPVDLSLLQRTAEENGRRCVVRAVIFDQAGRVFVPRRSATAATLPGIWDVVGGHVEPGETLEDALRREVAEETGWAVVGDPTLVFVGDGELPGDPPRDGREFDFVVSVDGDLSRPQLAPDEHVDLRWIERHETGIFGENDGRDGGLLRRIVTSAFAAQRDGEVTPHAMIISLDPPAPDVEELRRRWDPVMASRIEAHVTVTYPNEVPDLGQLTERVRRAARVTGPFELRLGVVVHHGDPSDGVFVQVHDQNDGWRELRASITATGVDPSIAPHVTLVHPRTSGLGRTAWCELHDRELERNVLVRSVAVTGFDGRGWVTLSRHPLG